MNDNDEAPGGSGNETATSAPVQYEALSPPPATLVELTEEVLADLGAVGHGLSWINADIATKALFGDHLVSALDTTSRNIAHAAQALDDLRATTAAIEERILEHLAGAVDTGTVDSIFPPPSDERELEFLARDGAISRFFVAVGATLDNLGLAVAIIGNRPVNLMERFTWPKLLNEGFPPDDTDGQRLLFDLRAAEAAAGPPGWLPWALDMRNLLVHRPRRLQLDFLTPVRGPDGEIVGVRSHLVLPVQPSLTDVETVRSTTDITGAVLPENAHTTVHGTLSGVRILTSRVTAVLLTQYRTVREAPADSRRPQAWWRDNVLPDRTSPPFAGFDPTTTPLATASLGLNPREAHRFQAAALGDAAKGRWPAWLGDMAVAHEQRSAERKAASNARRRERRARRKRS